MEKVGSTEDVTGVGTVVEAMPQPLPQVDQRPGAMTANRVWSGQTTSTEPRRIRQPGQAWSREHSHVPSATPPTYRLILGSRIATRKSRYDSE